MGNQNLWVQLVKEKITEIEKSKQEIAYDQDLGEVGFDSMKMMHLIVEIEMMFDIAFEDEDLLLENFMTIEKIVAMVEKHVQ